MRVINTYREVLNFKDSCSLRDKCYRLFDDDISIKEMKDIVDNDWRILLRRFPVEHGYSNLVKMFFNFVDGIFTRKELFFSTRSICYEIDSQIAVMNLKAEQAKKDFSYTYHTFLKEGAKKAKDADDDCTMMLYQALEHPEVEKIFMEFLEY